MKVVNPPERPTFDPGQISVFLAGSIEMGNAFDWQKEVCDALKDKDVLVLNPRRVDWDSSWEQRKSNDKFVEQVVWELDMLKQSTTIVMYLDENTKSPISLLELGLFAKDNKMFVCCPDEFWRQGNVDIVCERHSIPMVKTLEQLIEKINQLIDTNNRIREACNEELLDWKPEDGWEVGGRSVDVTERSEFIIEEDASIIHKNCKVPE